MELRKRVKAPRRYEDELVGDFPETPSRTPSPLQRSKRDYKGRFSEFNPNLPPAAFPSLDSRIPSPPSESRSASRRLDYATSLRSPMSQSRTETLPAHPLALQNLTATNSLPNLILSNNMRKMERLGNRTTLENNIADMETSDEEEPSRIGTLELPIWEDICLALRIDMVYAAAAAEKVSDADRAMYRLRLKEAQRRAMEDELRGYHEREEEENKNIKKHQQWIHDIMLARDQTYTQQSNFRQLLPSNLYKSVDREDTVSTPEDLRKAKSYLAACGLDSSCLDGWKGSARKGTHSDIELDILYPNSVHLSQTLAQQTPFCPSTPQVRITHENQPPPRKNQLLPLPTRRPSLQLPDVDASSEANRCISTSVTPPIPIPAHSPSRPPNIPTPCITPATAQQQQMQLEHEVSETPTPTAVITISSSPDEHDGDFDPVPKRLRKKTKKAEQSASPVRRKRAASAGTGSPARKTSNTPANKGSHGRTEMGVTADIDSSQLGDALPQTPQKENPLKKPPPKPKKSIASIIAERDRRQSKQAENAAKLLDLARAGEQLKQVATQLRGGSEDSEDELACL